MRAGAQPTPAQLIGVQERIFLDRIDLTRARHRAPARPAASWRVRRAAWARWCRWWAEEHKARGAVAARCSSNSARGEYARDEDGDGFCKMHVNTMEGFWLLLRSWLRPHRGISQDKLLLHLDLFQFVLNARRRGKALVGALITSLVA